MTNMAWQDLYKAALLELSPEELPRRLETAEAAMHQRLHELEKLPQGLLAPALNDERHAISDALRNLRTLAKSECSHPDHAVTNAPEDPDREVAS